MERKHLSFVMAIAFLTITLVFSGVLLHLHFKGADEVIGLHVNEQQLLKSQSSNWCSGLDIKSETPINAFKLGHDPKIHYPNREMQNLFYDIPPNMHGYDMARYLVANSRLKIYACTRGFRSYFLLVKGEDAAEKCHKALQKMTTEDEDQTEMKELKSGREIIKSFIKNHPFNLEDRFDFIQMHRYCPQALVFSVLEEKEDQFQGQYCKNTPEDGGYELNIPDDDKYVMLTGNLGKKKPVYMNITLNLERAQYDLGNTKYVCVSSTFCHMPLDMGEEPRIVVAPTGGTENMYDDTTKVFVYCTPRLMMYTLSYVAIPVAILLVLGCIGAIFCKNSKPNYHYVYLQEREGARQPLLGPACDEKRSRGRQESCATPQAPPPPPYYDPERQDSRGPAPPAYQ